VLNRLPMFDEILDDGVRWPDGTVLQRRCHPLVHRFSQFPRSSGAAHAARTRRRHNHDRQAGHASRERTRESIWSATAPPRPPSARIAPAEPRQGS
jgi:hypothetical protein